MLVSRKIKYSSSMNYAHFWAAEILAALAIYPLASCLKKSHAPIAMLEIFSLLSQVVIMVRTEELQRIAWFSQLNFAGCPLVILPCTTAAATWLMYTSDGHQNKATTTKKHIDFNVMNYQKKKRKAKAITLRTFWKNDVAILIYLASIAQKENTKNQIKYP